MAHHISEEQPHLQAHHTPVRKQVQTPVSHPAGPRNLPQWTPPATEPRPKLPVLEPPYRGPDVHELELKGKRLIMFLSGGVENLLTFVLAQPLASSYRGPRNRRCT
ncbi:hypothetical protein CPLU01_09833 [Colletotrichum plurivorum]|uniref:Uncharacterized protein n=1 Tax=Colletotrichum plurivorum TaxID=2175906 RepID=A0A8H6K7Y0_9PEZI|nr:hypothetical protein CPLU01_09833 [Colletotrichum plurivorum]